MFLLESKKTHSQTRTKSLSISYTIDKVMSSGKGNKLAFKSIGLDESGWVDKLPFIKKVLFLYKQSLPLHFILLPMQCRTRIGKVLSVWAEAGLVKISERLMLLYTICMSRDCKNFILLYNVAGLLRNLCLTSMKHLMPGSRSL